MNNSSSSIRSSDIEDLHFYSDLHNELSQNTENSSSAAFSCPFSRTSAGPILLAAESECLCESVLGKVKISSKNSESNENSSNSPPFCRPANCAHSAAQFSSPVEISRVRPKNISSSTLSESPREISRAAIYGLGSGVKNPNTEDNSIIPLNHHESPVQRVSSRSASPIGELQSSSSQISPQVAPAPINQIHPPASPPLPISEIPPPFDYSNYDISKHRQPDGTFLDIPVQVRHHDPQLNYYSWNEIRRHNSRHDCWLVSKGRVYDCTAFLPLHPAGPKSIVRHAGMDATVHFDFHSAKA